MDTSVSKSAKSDGRTTNTRARILREAERLYYHGGYAGISLQDIADELGLTKAALFHHFRSKRDLFFETLLEMLAQRRARIEDAIASSLNTVERLRAILRVLAATPFFDPMKFMTDERGNLSPQQQQEIEAAFASAIQQPIAGVLAEGVARGDLRPHPPMLGVMLFLNLAMLLPSPGHPTSRLASEAELSSYIDELLTFYLHGVSATDSGRE